MAWLDWCVFGCYFCHLCSKTRLTSSDWQFVSLLTGRTRPLVVWVHRVPTHPLAWPDDVSEMTHQWVRTSSMTSWVSSRRTVRCRRPRRSAHARRSCACSLPWRPTTGSTRSSACSTVTRRHRPSTLPHPADSGASAPTNVRHTMYAI